MLFLKKLLTIGFSFLSLLFFLFCIYFLLFFFPYIDDLKEKSKSIPNSQKNFVLLHKKTIECLESNKNSVNRMQSFVSRIFLKELILKNEFDKFDWHTHSFLWYFLVGYFFKSDEIMAFYFHYFHLEKNCDIECFIKKKFKKELIDLTEKEVITLLLITRIPAYIEDKNQNKLNLKVIELSTKLDICQ